MEQIFSWIFDVLEIFLNLLEFFAILISVGTLLFFTFNKHSRTLKVVLGPLGLSHFRRLRVLILCRSSMLKKRAFLEFALLKTQGYVIRSKEWGKIIGEFKVFWHDEGDLVYTVENCTPLIDDNFSTAFGRYFSCLSEEKNKHFYGIDKSPVRTVIRIRVTEAYVTPTCLLSGLLAKYEESWEDFIKSFVSTAYISDKDDATANNILSDELYLTFAWLLWGPSYEIEYSDFWDGLCQVSYGDESNSFPAFVDRDSQALDRIQKKFIQNHEHRYGALLSTDIFLYEKHAFLTELRTGIHPENAYFYDKIENSDASFAAQIVDFSHTTNYKAKKYYCTAYVWLLFEAVTSPAQSFRPETSLAFFEHANLADKATYTFLIETLIDKAFKHFRRIFEDGAFDGRSYRFICAFNEGIHARFASRYAEEIAKGTPFAEALRTRLCIEPSRQPATVFAEYDRFFDRNQGLHFSEVSIDDKASLTELGHFYTEIYMECFPDVDERESFDNLLHYLARAKDAKDYRYHIILAKDDEENIVAGGIFDYFVESNTGMIEFIAVKPALQSAGFGTKMYEQIRAVLTADANRYGHKTPEHLFCEIDSPEYSKANVRKYLYFWNKNHYKHLDFSYVQPALSVEKEPVTGLWLNVTMLHSTEGTIDGETVLSVLRSYMKFCMQIEHPEENTEYIRMEKEIRSRGKIPLLPIL